MTKDKIEQPGYVIERFIKDRSAMMTLVLEVDGVVLTAVSGRVHNSRRDGGSGTE